MDMRMPFRKKHENFIENFFLTPVGVFNAVWSAFHEKTYNFLFCSTGRSRKRQKFRFSVKIKKSAPGKERKKKKRQPTEIDYLCEYGIVINMSVAIRLW